MEKRKNSVALEKIFDFLSLELTDSSYIFFNQVKKSFNGDLELFGDFISDYLTIQKNGSVPEDLYYDFVTYFHDMLEIQGEEKLLEQFARWAKYYLMLNFEYLEIPEIREVVSIINERGIRAAYPFLMELMEDFEFKRIDENAFLNMAQSVLSMADNADRNEFARFSLQVNQMLFNSAKNRMVS